MTSIGDELERRLHLWAQIRASGIPNDIDPSALRSMRAYGGAQGIWVDKRQTEMLSTDRHGVTVSILHTGRHYPDDLSDDGVIYHYPTTRRPSGRDAAEVGATKNAATLSLPIFVLLPGKTVSRRSVRLGWVVDFDDESKQFLILFGEERPEYEPAPPSESPFELVGGPASRTATTKARPGQQRFRFQVLAQYGCKCAVCSITHPSLMKAAHIRGKAQNGSDDWRNGIPLCSTHHDAFDAHLFVIDPDTLKITTMPGVSPTSIGVAELMLTPMRCRPHSEALSWRLGHCRDVWSTRGITEEN